jgi:hypothetical protein
MFFGWELSCRFSSSEFESCLEIFPSDFLGAEASRDPCWELCSEAFGDYLRDALPLGARIDPLGEFFLGGILSDSAGG